MRKVSYTKDLFIKEESREVKGSVREDGVLLDEKGNPITENVLVLPDGTTTKLSAIARKGAEAPTWQRAIVQVLVAQQAASLRALADQLEDSISATTITDIKKEMEASGLIDDEDVEPKLIISDTTGAENRRVFKEKEESGFVVDKSLGDYVDSLPENMTRIPPKTLETKSVLEALFDSGEIPDLYKPYFSKHPTKKVILAATKK